MQYHFIGYFEEIHIQSVWAVLYIRCQIGEVIYALLTLSG